MGVQADDVHRKTVARIDHAEPVVHDMAAQAEFVFEAHEVPRIRVGHEDTAGARLHGHLEQAGANAGDRGDFQRPGVDDEQVVVREAQGQAMGPVLAVLIQPFFLRRIPPHDQAHRRHAAGRIGQFRAAGDALRQVRISRRRRALAAQVIEAQRAQAAGIETGVVAGDDIGVDHGGLVARPKHHRVHAAAIA